MRQFNVLLSLLLLPAVAQAQDARILMLGNSYTAQNALHQLLDEALTEAAPAWSDVYAESIAPGGYTLAEHASRADGSEGITAQREALVTGPDAGSWQFVFLQDQSQVPGFPESEPMWQASRDGAVTLDTLVTDGGAETIFLLTWGRRDGDGTNPTLYPDFTTMQGRLLDGYLAYVEAASSDGTQAWVAPAGLAFAEIHDDLVAAGEDPTDAASAFYALYSGDGSHPSHAGSYLAALAATVALTGHTVIGISGPDGLDADTITLLQAAAWDAVQDDLFGDVPYRFAHEWADWTDPGDVGVEGRIVSDTVLRPVVRVSSDLDLEDLHVGAEHDGPVAGAGELRVTDGTVNLDTLTLGEHGDVRVDGGSLRAAAVTGDGGAILTDGELWLGGGDLFGLTHRGGVLTLAGPTVVHASYDLPPEGTLTFEVTPETTPTGSFLGEVTLAGTVAVVIDGELGDSGEVVLMEAGSLTTTGLTTSLPEDFQLDVSVTALTLRWGQGVGDDDDATGPGDDDDATAADDDAGIDDPGAGGCSCGCGSRGAGASASLLVLLLGLRLRNGRRAL
jgi:hypothetical protein